MNFFVQVLCRILSKLEENAESEGNTLLTSWENVWVLVRLSSRISQNHGISLLEIFPDKICSDQIPPPPKKKKNMRYVTRKLWQTKSFTVPNFTKLITVEWHAVTIGHTELVGSKSRSMERKGRNVFTLVSEIWLSLSWFSQKLFLLDKFLWITFTPKFTKIRQSV
jgi:hypothetical protein